MGEKVQSQCGNHCALLAADPGCSAGCICRKLGDFSSRCVSDSLEFESVVEAEPTKSQNQCGNHCALLAADPGCPVGCTCMKLGDFESRCVPHGPATQSLTEPEPTKNQCGNHCSILAADPGCGAGCFCMKMAD